MLVNMKGGEILARENLRHFRRSLGLSLEEAAEKIGCTRVHLNNIELGKTDGTLDFWEKFQKAFGIEDYDFWTLIKRKNS